MWQRNSKAYQNTERYFLEIVKGIENILRNKNKLDYYVKFI